MVVGKNCLRAAFRTPVPRTAFGPFNLVLAERSSDVAALTKQPYSNTRNLRKANAFFGAGLSARSR